MLSLIEGRRWTKHMSAGWRFMMLYVKGMITTKAAGGADNDSRDSRFRKEARRVEGRCLLSVKDQLT